MKPQAYQLITVAICITLSACGNFRGLKENIETLERDYIDVSGVAASKSCNGCTVMIATLSNTKDETLSLYTISKSGEPFSFKVPRDSRRVFLFADKNQNFTYDKDEEYAWYSIEDHKGMDASSAAAIELKKSQLEAPTFALGNLLLASQQSIPLQKGKITTLSNPIFSKESASQGMWRPAEFVLEGKAGIYLLESYSTTKTPIIFVHGIDGNPSAFSTIISKLDRSKYQPWVFFYPSGLELNVIARGLEGLMTELFIRYQPKQAHLVAHSMGGLVTRKYLGLCGEAASCTPFVSYTTIASPFGGHAAAQGGVDYSPVVMPVWNDMAPSSDFLAQLPKSALPKNLKHHLIFAYLAGESSDSVIEISSQLHQPIQQNASTVRGFEGSHTGVLDEEILIEYLNSIWQEN